jgi:cysteine desulfurase
MKSLSHIYKDAKEKAGSASPNRTAWGFFGKKKNPDSKISENANQDQKPEPPVNPIHKITPRASVQKEDAVEKHAGRIYLDYASLTPIDPRVKKVMIEAMDEYPANPSSLYKEGVKAKKALHDARVSIAQFFSVQPDEIIFTSGGTESNNLAFQGVITEYERDASEGSAQPHVIISTIEHPSIVEISLDLTSRGYDVSFIPVNADGIVDPKDIKKALRPETVLVSIMYANNEIGTIQPIKDIAREVRHYKKSLSRGNGDYPYIHTDACQAVLYEDMRIPTLGVDMMTIDGGKIYGPRGMGVLVKRRHVELAPVFQGGSQEFGLRAGTENLPAIIGLKHALDIAHSEREEMINKMKRFQETMLDLLFARLTDFVPNMSLNGHRSDRLPNNVNICFPNMDAEFLVLRLDALGIALSSVTSCRANDEDSSSYVIEALGKGKSSIGQDEIGHDIDSCAQSSLRITFGRFTTAEEIAVAIEKIVQAVKEQVKG